MVFLVSVELCYEVSEREGRRGGWGGVDRVEECGGGVVEEGERERGKGGGVNRTGGCPPAGRSFLWSILAGSPPTRYEPDLEVKSLIARVYSAACTARGGVLRGEYACAGGGGWWGWCSMGGGGGLLLCCVLQKQFKIIKIIRSLECYYMRYTTFKIRFLKLRQF